MTEKLTTFHGANAHVGTSSPLSAPKRSDAQPMDRLLSIARLLFGSRCDAGQGRRVALSSAQRRPCPVWLATSGPVARRRALRFRMHRSGGIGIAEKQHDAQCRAGFLHISFNLGTSVIFLLVEANDVG